MRVPAHRLIVGMTRSGKTNLMLIDLLEYAMLRTADSWDYWITAAFPHRKAGIDFISELYARMGKAVFRRMIVEDLEDLSAVVMREFLRRSSATGYKRQNENDLNVKANQDLIYRARSDIKSLGDHPVLDKYSRLAFRTFHNLVCWIPEYLIPYVLRPKHRMYQYIKKHIDASTPEGKELLWELSQIERMSWKEQFHNLEPAARALELTFGSTPIKVRCSKKPTFDNRAFLNSGGIRVILGGEVSADSVRTFVGCDILETARLVKSGLDVSGIYACDEVVNYHLMGNEESRLLATMQGLGSGMSLWQATQGLNYPTPEITSNCLNNSDQYWFVSGDPEIVKVAARSLIGTLDPHKELYRKKVQRHGGVEEVQKRSKGVSKTDTGKTTESEHTGSQLISTFYFDEEPVRQSGSEQLIFKESDLASFPVGSCMVRPRNGTPYRRDVELLEDSWECSGEFPGLKGKKVAECLARIKALPVYQTPENVEISIPASAATNSGGGGTKKPSKNLPKAPKRRGI